MQTHRLEPVEVLRQGVTGQRPMDGDVVASMALLAEKLHALKAASPMFEGISFSSDVEAMMAAEVAAVMN
jgi:hypothetical protein